MYWNIILLNGDDNIMINETKKKNEQVTVEYGTEKNLKDILSDYLIQRFVEILNNEQEK